MTFAGLSCGPVQFSQIAVGRLRGRGQLSALPRNHRRAGTHILRPANHRKGRIDQANGPHHASRQRTAVNSSFEQQKKVDARDATLDSLYILQSAEAKMEADRATTELSSAT